MACEKVKSPRATQQNWNALQRLALTSFKEWHGQHPDWKIEDLLGQLDLPRTALMLELAEKAGFHSRNDPTPEEMVAVAHLCMQGVWSEQVIAEEAGIALERVRKIFELRKIAYGSAPYGKAPYGGNRKYSDGKAAVPRRVTVVGQLSYRGRTYNLGTSYRGRVAMVLERGSKLIAGFADRPTRTLTLRR